jgi:ABC-type transport system substrate-binding protein
VVGRRDPRPPGPDSTTLDEDERAALYSELHRYAYDNPPFIYLYEPFAFEGINVAVQNYNHAPPRTTS